MHQYDSDAYVHLPRCLMGRKDQLKDQLPYWCYCSSLEARGSIYKWWFRIVWK